MINLAKKYIQNRDEHIKMSNQISEKIDKLNHSKSEILVTWHDHYKNPTFSIWLSDDINEATREVKINKCSFLVAKSISDDDASSVINEIFKDLADD